MAEHEGHGWTLLAADAKVMIRPCVLHRIVLNASVDGGDVTLYHGRDTGGVSLGVYEGLAKITLPIELGVLLEDGLYVDVGSNVTSILVVFDPLAEP